MHYVDVGPRDGNVMLLMHGMPTWSYLYRDMIPALTAARYRCIAPDFMGFDRSDKPTDIHWYTIARHTEILTTPITALDFNDITLVSQDWAGSIGLAQAVHMPERFERLVIMNTWLHHPTYEYSEAIKFWNKNLQDGGIFHHEQPDLGLVVATMGYGARREDVFNVSGKNPTGAGRWSGRLLQRFLRALSRITGRSVQRISPVSAVHSGF